jgi:hypothetical protein
MKEFIGGAILVILATIFFMVALYAIVVLWMS